MEAADNGIFIGNESALEKLARCDCFIFSPGIAWRPGGRGAEEIGTALRDLGVEEILTPMGSMDGSRTLTLLQKGVGDARPVDAGGLIKERQYLGKEVAFIGDCSATSRPPPRLTWPSMYAIRPFTKSPAAEIAFFEPELEGVLALRGSRQRIITGPAAASPPPSSQTPPA